MRILATILALLAKAKQKVTYKQKDTHNRFGPDPMCMVGLNRGVSSRNNCRIPCEE